MEEQKTTYNLEIASYAEVKESLNRRQRLELERDRLNVKLDELRNKIKEAKNLKSEYDANLRAIEFNKKVDSSVSLSTSNIQVARHEHDEIIKRIENIKNEIKRLTDKIDFNSKMIVIVDKELTVEKMYKLYIDMVGKKGVSKIVLRSVLPIINSELERLLEGVCEFDVEVRMDDKNDVQLIMIKDGVEGPLKSTSGFERTVSSVAMRCVLGVVSTLPMPNFIAFDEVLDRVAPENIPNMKPLFDKIKDMYDKVFIITHDDLARDWSDKMITITKSDNISVINFYH
jgi:DNA repair exonuclease SbcCD ATPase subunit